MFAHRSCVLCAGTDRRDGPGVLNPKSDLENDNIFTRWDRDDKIRGSEPELRIEPAEATDSLLVNDPVPSR